MNKRWTVIEKSRTWPILYIVLRSGKLSSEGFNICSEQNKLGLRAFSSNKICLEEGKWARGSEEEKAVDLLRARRKTFEILTNQKAAIFVQRIFSHLFFSGANLGMQSQVSFPDYNWVYLEQYFHLPQSAGIKFYLSKKVSSSLKILFLQEYAGKNTFEMKY
jgi:hypothetical protein